MHALSAFRQRVLIFPDALPLSHGTTRQWAPYVSLAVATLALYTICNAPADKLAALVSANRWWSGWLAPKYVAPDEFVRRFVVPLKGLLFGAAVALLLVPVVRAAVRGLREIDRAALRRSAGLTLILLAICWALCWPYHTSMWAVGNWGTFFARMSEDPFAEPHNYFHRRLLKPGLAYFLQFRGPLLYWLLTMICTTLVSFLIVLYFELCLTRRRGGEDSSPIPDGFLRALAALGVMSTNVVMLHLAAPGYVDDLLAILILLQLVLPLTLKPRLCLVALSMATHEAAAVFGLGPLVLVVFPNWAQRFAAWGVMGSFFIFWLASYGFDFPAAFGVHTQFENASTFDIMRANPRTLALGVFMAHKFFWIVFFAALWRLIARKEFTAAGALAACTLASLGTIPIATDTSRLVGMGFSGILFAVVVVLPELRSSFGRRLFVLACVASVLVPYYPSGASWLEVPAGGYYKAVYMYVRGFF
ncbi:MAG TPA: hypothetical protein VGR35_15035 [Tepidisphaeraceae bacterium]|nr:hypothetical protein [Tepidisphaeraceae bacterium]